MLTPGWTRSTSTVYSFHGSVCAPVSSVSGLYGFRFLVAVRVCDFLAVGMEGGLLIFRCFKFVTDIGWGDIRVRVV